MLNFILNHPKLTREGVFSILLLPPATSNEPYDYDYLGNRMLISERKKKLT